MDSGAAGTAERETCVRALRALVARADREQLGAAQNLLLTYALGTEGAARRAEALDGLLADLSRDGEAGRRSQAQQAFHAVLVGMIERTRMVVGPADRDVQA